MADDLVVNDPTYMAHIRSFFRPIDVNCMGQKGYDLSTYEGVRKHALAIYAHTGPTGDMPKDPSDKWSANRHKTFYNWIINKFPLGVAVPKLTSMALNASLEMPRVRKNITALSDDEVKTLKDAFRGVMSRDPAESNSYFAIAGIHGLPGAWCAHHINQYNPWHRVLLMTFEDALRSVPGCSTVTLPYWDISTPIPPLLSEDPFANYTLPLDPGAMATPPQPGAFFPYTTQRFDAATIAQNVADYGVLDDIATSEVQTMWGAYNINGYQDFSIQAHDSGHGSIGPTMLAQEVAAFDPVFWFFHCNLDRLWLKWQRSVNATTLAGFKSTVTGDLTWLDGPPPFNSLMPFTTTSDQTMDLGVAYAEEPVAEARSAFENLVGSLEAGRRFKIKSAAPVSVRVKNIARLNIPGSFVVHLRADGKTIAKRVFFQPNTPAACPTCAKNELVNIDFRVEQQKIVDRQLTVAIEVPSQAAMGTEFPLSTAGNPTINARLLLEDE